MLALLASVFSVSLLGSLHCVGMCGPFALLAGTHGAARPSDNKPASGRHWLAVTGYHLGRLTTYCVLGVVCGAVGMFVDFGGSLYGWQQVAGYIAGSFMIFVGILSVLRCLGLRIDFRWQQPLGRLWQPLLRRAVGLPPLMRAAAIGALTTLMPCGWLYVFAITAAGVAHPVWGAVVMTVFWAGSVPLLVLLMWSANGCMTQLRVNVPLTTACLVIVAGVFTIFFRAPVSLSDQSPAVDRDPAILVNHLESIRHYDLPCCHAEEHE